MSPGRRRRKNLRRRLRKRYERAVSEMGLDALIFAFGFDYVEDWRLGKMAK